MNILYSLNSANPGGMEQHVLDLVNGMVGRKHGVYVVCPEGTMSGKFAGAGATVINRDINLDIDPVYIWRLIKDLTKNEISVVHTHEVKAVSNSLIAGILGKTPVRISHTHTPVSEWQIDALRKNINKIFYSFIVNRLSTTEIALTESRKEVKVLEGIDTRLIEIIPNGLETGKYSITSELKRQYRKEILDRYGIPEDTFIFGSLGRISEEKGHFVLADAFSRFLMTTGVDGDVVHLIIAGGGVKEDELKAKLNDLGISNKVTITGKFTEEDKIKLYASFDMFLFPSLAEGFGIVLIEAMASGLPVICSDLRVLQEVGGSVVFYFETGNADSLAEKMKNLYMRDGGFEELTLQARERVDTLYSMEKFVNSYEYLYFELLGREG